MGMSGTRLRDDSGEVASWLILVVGLVAAAALAAGVMSSTINDLAVRVGLAAQDTAGVDMTPRTVPNDDATGPAADSTTEGGTTDDGTPSPERVDSGPADSDEIARITEIEERIGDGEHPSSAAAQIELRNAVLGLFPDDPETGQAVLGLMQEGASFQFAFAEATGDWSGVPGGDPSVYGADEINTILDMLGLDVPPGALPDDLDALIDALPNWLLAELFDQGRTYGLEAPLGGIGTPGTILPANISAEVLLTGSTSLSDPRVGIGFDQTQSVEITTQLLVTGNVSAGKSTLGKVYKWLDRLDVVPGPVQDALQRSPLLRTLVRGLPFSVSYERFEGLEFSYEATINREQGIQLDAGYPEVLPNLFDPTSFEVGNSVLIRGGDVEGTSFGLKYKALYTEGTVTEFDGIGFGVTMLPDGRFAVYSGPIEIIENEFFVGVPVAGVVSTTALTTNEFAYAELDLDTPQGLAAFDDFVTGGGVPQSDTTGVITATTEVITVDDQLSGEIRLGPLSGSSTWRDESSEMAITTWSDDRRDFSAGFDVAGATFEVTAPINADGVANFDNSTVSMVFENIDEGTTGGLNYTFNNAVGVEGPQHVQIDFTASQLDDLISSAQQSVENRGSPSALPGDLIAVLADSSTPNEVIYEIIAHARLYGATSTAHELTALANSITGGLDGTIDTRPAN